ncbi:MAG: lysylphosphatidylglycerol synthase transmembrane domain-containing protein [Gemmatimonadaceae bacterium]
MSPERRRIVLTVTWIIASVLVWLLARTVDRETLWRLLARANGAWIALALFCNLLIMFSWTGQWRALLPTSRPVDWRRMLSIVGITAVVGNVIPASGQITTVLLLAREPNVTYTAAISVLALDQLLEAICKTTVVLFAATLLPLPEDMKRAVIVLAAIAVALVITLVIFANQKRWLVRFASELESLRNMRRFSVGISYCLAAKFFEFSAIIAVQRAFGEHISLSVTVLVEAAILLGTIFPLSPANIGTYEASVSIVYRQFGVSHETALGLALVQHVCVLLSTVGTGYIFFVLRRRRENFTA